MGGTSYELSTDETVIEGVVAAVADASDCDSLDLPPLSTVIDPDALQSLYRSKAGARTHGDWRVEFTYNGFRVVVHSYGLIKVRPPLQEDPDGRGTGGADI